MAKKPDDGGKKIIAKNRRAFHDFEILEQIEAGIMLTGTEVKSLRDGKVVLDESFARIRDGNANLLGVNIPPYANGGHYNHEPDRVRKLLLHKREIRKLEEKTERERLTIVPLELYWKRGFCKVLLGVARGKKLYDKRQSIREREDKRSIQRALRGRD